MQYQIFMSIVHALLRCRRYIHQVTLVLFLDEGRSREWDRLAFVQCAFAGLDTFVSSYSSMQQHSSTVLIELGGILYVQHFTLK